MSASPSKETDIPSISSNCFDSRKHSSVVDNTGGTR